MPLDVDAVRRGCRGANVSTARQLCRAELERFRTAAASGEPLTVGCTQEAPLFSEAAEGDGVKYVNIRETAGWSKDAKAAGPKMAALDRGRAGLPPEIPFVTFNSEGVISCTAATSRRSRPPIRSDHLDVTALSLPADVTPPRVTEFGGARHPLRRAISAPSDHGRRLCAAGAVSRGALAFGAGRNGAVSNCDRARHLARRRCLLPPICATRRLRADPGDPPRCSKQCSRRATSLAPSTSRATSPYGRPLRAFRSKIVGTPPRSLPDRRHRARRRSRGDRRPCLRRLRAMRRCPDRRRPMRCRRRHVDAPAARCSPRIVRPAHAAGRAFSDAHGVPLIDALRRRGLLANVLPLAVNEARRSGWKLSRRNSLTARRRCGCCCAQSRATTPPA